MEKTKVYQLNEGTVLDGRYEIGRVLGEGGFGITYAGTNIRSGKAVAVKEFFCLDYMARGEDGVKAVLTDRSERKRFTSERNRFMREARILAEFKDEPGVVTVLDYFESGGTAYLVMEYIDGETLHERVKKNGAIKPEVFFEEIRPLLKTLSKVHEAGVIHRDISPDNIMRMSDGRLVLIDFGSAKDLSGRTVTTATTYKDGFAPPEQYASGKKQGPATDIYALAATFYYCLTAARPESAIQRVMLDELRPVHELEGDIPEDIEQMINKGMSLSVNDRYKSITEMEEIIEARYPLLSPEEKERLRKQRMIRRAVLAAAGLLILALATVHVVRNSAAYRMRMQDTEVIYLSWSDAEDGKNSERIEESAKVVKNRLEVYAGRNNYLWNEEDAEGRTKVVIPAKLVGNCDPELLLRKYITRPVNEFKIMHATRNMQAMYSRSENGNWELLPESTIEKADIVKAEPGEGRVPTGKNTEAILPYVRVYFNIDPASKKEFFDEKGQRVVFEISAETKPFQIPGFAAGDGESLYIVPQEAVDAEAFEEAIQTANLGNSSHIVDACTEEPLPVREILAYDLTNEGPTEYAGVEAEPSINWESPDNVLAGKNQVPESEIPGGSLLIEYSDSSQYDKSALGKSEWVNVISSLRTRLDALGIPYAFGISKSNDRVAAIKVKEGDMSQAEILMLGINPYMSLLTRTEHAMAPGSLLYSVESKGEEITALSIGTYNVDTAREFVEQRAEKGEEITLVLDSLGSYPVGTIWPADAAEAQLNNGMLALSEFGIGGDERDSAKKDRLMKYVNAIESENIARTVVPIRVCRYDKKGRYQEMIAIEDVEGGFYPQKQKFTEEIDRDIKKELGDDYGAAPSVSDGLYHMDLTDGSIINDGGFEDAVVKKAEEYLKKYDFDGHDVDVNMHLSNDIEVKRAGNVERIVVTLRFSRASSYDTDRKGEYLLTYYNVGAGRDGKNDPDLVDAVTERLKAALRKSETLSKMIYDPEVLVVSKK